MARQRTDESSLSFGRRLKKAEASADKANKRAASLESQSPTAAERENQLAARRARRAERQKAADLLSSYGSSSDDLRSIDKSVLTKAQQNQVDQAITAAAFSEAAPSGVSFTPEAQLRIANWKNQSAQHGQAFLQNNGAPSFAEPQSSFEKWTTRQDSAEGRRIRQQKLQNEQEKILRQSVTDADQMQQVFENKRRAKLEQTGKFLGMPRFPEF